MIINRKLNSNIIIIIRYAINVNIIIVCVYFVKTAAATGMVFQIVQTFDVSIIIITLYHDYMFPLFVLSLPL